jgi:hypothetical protein
MCANTCGEFNDRHTAYVILSRQPLTLSWLPTLGANQQPGYVATL